MLGALGFHTLTSTTAISGGIILFVMSPLLILWGSFLLISELAKADTVAKTLRGLRIKHDTGYDVAIYVMIIVGILLLTVGFLMSLPEGFLPILAGIALVFAIAVMLVVGEPKD